VDDEAARSVREQLERHLAECRTCSVLYDTTRRTIRDRDGRGSWEVAGGLSERLLSKNPGR
jgi:hypothetical protein